MSGGNKFDSEKVKYSLIDPYFLEDLARVMGFGASKYGDYNWTKGIEVTRILNSLRRHTAAMEMGEDIDPESGVLHAAHVAANAMFLHYFLRNNPELDDRFYNRKKRGAADA
jgi:hypothetical protein